MKAIVQERFGSPDVLHFVDVDLPEIGPDDVLVRVHAAALNPYDWHMLRGDPYVARLMGEVGLTKHRHKNRIAGADGAGTVEAVGANLHGLQPGDEVARALRRGRDNVGNHPLRRLRRALTPTETLVSNAGSTEDWTRSTPSCTAPASGAWPERWTSRGGHRLVEAPAANRRPHLVHVDGRRQLLAAGHGDDAAPAAGPAVLPKVPVPAGRPRGRCGPAGAAGPHPARNNNVTAR
jgi:hypothetical protein